MYYVITHRWDCDPQLVEHTDEEPWTEQVICKGICVFLTIWRVSIPKTPTLFKVQLCFKFIDQFGENWNFNNDEPYDLWSLHISTLMYNFLRFLSLVLFLAIVHSFVPDSLLPMDCSMPGFPIHHYLPQFAQNHVSWVNDAIEPSPHTLPLPSPPVLNLSQYQGLF